VGEDTAVPVRARVVPAGDAATTVLVVAASPGAAPDRPGRAPPVAWPWTEALHWLRFAESHLPADERTVTATGRDEVGPRIESAGTALVDEGGSLVRETGEPVVPLYGPWVTILEASPLDGHPNLGPADPTRSPARAESYAQQAGMETAPPPRAVDGREAPAARDAGRIAAPPRQEVSPGTNFAGSPGPVLAGWPVPEGRGGFSRRGAPLADPAGRAVPRPEAESSAAVAAVAAGQPEVLPAPSAAGPEIVSLAVKAGALLEAGLPLDLPVLKQEVDAFFARLGELGEGGDGLRAGVRLAPWLVLLAAGAFELARRWEKRSSRRGRPGDEVVLGPAALLTGEE
jgi:hypothetical protein